MAPNPYEPFAGAIPVQGRTQPLAIPEQPDGASIIMQAAQMRLQRDKMQQDALKGISDSIMSAAELWQASKKAQMENAIASAGLELKDRLAKEEASREAFYKGQDFGLRKAEGAQKQANFEREMGLKEREAGIKQRNVADGKMLPPAQILAINEGKNVARVLPDINKTIEDNESLFGPVAGRWSSANPYNERAKLVDAKLRSASQMFGRFMEGGVLRKEDEAKYRTMFPQLSDTPQVARGKLAQIRKLLTEKYQDDKTTVGRSGYDVSGFGDLPADPAAMLLEMGGARDAAGPKPTSILDAIRAERAKRKKK